MVIQKSLKIQKFAIGIIGFGPKGLYAFERLLAQIKSNKIKRHIEVHIFNQNKFFGAGNVYRKDQPDYLIMNYANKKIDLWSKEFPQPVVEKTPDFAQWLAHKKGTQKESQLDRFAPRPLVGCYYEETFQQLRDKAPLNVEIFTHVATIDKINERNNRLLLYSSKTEKYYSTAFDELMLTTGHLGCGAGFDHDQSTQNYVDFIYPVSEKFEDIVAGEKVGIKGLGLTFIDATLSLTEGRGGQFKIDKANHITYITSGREPLKIYPFSRSGLPMIPRGAENDNEKPLHFFNQEAILRLKAQQQINFKRDLFPVLKKEFHFSYYEVLFETYGWELKFYTDYQKIDNQIDQFHITFPALEKFDWDLFINPFLNIHILSHDSVIDYIKFLLQESEKGLNNSPLIAAASVWRKISSGFNELYSFSGLDAESHRFVDSEWFGLFNRISYGPPIQNMKKILALAEAGILDFTFSRSPQIRPLTSKNATGYVLKLDEHKVEIDHLINARVPRKDLSKNLLFKSLMDMGLACKYVNNKNGRYNPGCIALDVKGRVVDNKGQLQNNITCYGTPTEGVTFDNDTLSRKRNDFASHWAYDIVLKLKREEQECQLKNSPVKLGNS